MSMQLTIFEHSKTEKRCSKCKELKPFANFSKDKNRKYGFDYICKQCQKCYFQNNKEALTQRRKVYRDNNKEIIKQRGKVYYENNKEKIAQQKKFYYDNNKEAAAVRSRIYTKKRLKSDPLFRLICNLRRRNNLFIKSVGMQKNWSTIDAMGCNREEFIAYFEPLFTEGMTWENYGDWHVDHIKPISLATTKQEAIQLSHYTNLQPLWAEDNIRKSNKYD